jgi:ADP-heptose:LPS heptosyltransferase
MSKSRNLYRLTRFVIFKLRLLLRLLAFFRTSQKRLLIIKIDAIGDYVLFRNFLEILKNSQRFSGYKIDLIGNELWKDIALKYDAQFISEFMFIKPLPLYEAPGKMFKLGWQIFKNNYSVVLQPSFTRNLINDGLAGFTVAPQIIGFESDNEVLQQKFKRRTDKFYTEKLLLPPAVNFEFDRTRYFFETVLAQSINLNSPVFNIPQGKKSGVIVFPGAGSVKRSWEAEKFAGLIKLILQHSQQQIFVAGGSSEQAIGDYLASNLPPNSFINLIDKTSLPELIEHISGAALIIANDSSAIHIAVATGTPSVCILGGGHFERFAPYPRHMQNRPHCVYEKLPCYYCNWHCKFKTEKNEPYPCISNLTLATVWQVIKPMLLS